MQLDPKALSRLPADAAAAQQFLEVLGSFAANLVGAAFILVGTLWLSGALSRLIRRRFGVGRRRRRVDATLVNFIASLARYLILITGLIAVLQQLGVKTTSILAVLGAASLAVGLALQGTLSNVAAGVMLLILRPYRVNDYVEINGRQGVVKNLDLFTTELASPDGLKLIMPNSKVFGELIINFNTLGTRRLQQSFTIDFANDVQRALDLLLRLAGEDQRILADPPAWAGVTAITERGVTVTLRAWTAALAVGDVETDILNKAKDAFLAEGLVFPYPHQVGVTRQELAEIMRP